MRREIRCWGREGHRAGEGRQPTAAGFPDGDPVVSVSLTVHDEGMCKAMCWRGEQSLVPGRSYEKIFLRGLIPICLIKGVGIRRIVLIGRAVRAGVKPATVSRVIMRWFPNRAELKAKYHLATLAT